MLERTARPLVGLWNGIAAVSEAVYRGLGSPGKLLQDFLNGSWLGHSLHPVLTDVVVGGASVRIGGPVPRCAVVDHHPETGVKDVRLLEALVRGRPTNRAGEPVLGVYATCTRPGRVTVGR